MDTEKLNHLLNWVVEYNYKEDTKASIGYTTARIWIRDEEEKLHKTFKTLDDESRMYLACSLIQMVANPCEDYADDFNCESKFGFEFSWENGITFRASFRV